ncbi:unnamed protein product [Arctia plantaginis]|uniref:NADH dehydrogenase [ubiquinone] 1 beta subcomplex subunit 4 n=1 Tax=Arctia plantaginis TaxID=874455 RepID=A0A8S1AWV4_ARCPL|nr:unnamed protein product [Arctia plantaginis]CAB3254400.1 unnamed protein product [Arctia plantaginis]
MGQCKGSDFGVSDLELKIICDQVERRKRYREEFLKARTDPCLHSKEAGYVFDPAIQRFLSLKNTHLEYFTPTFANIRFGVCIIILPMLTYGYAIWTQRTKIEWDRRCGKTKYRDRLFKFA